MLDLNRIKKIYFIGIGGIMMSAVVRYFLALGKEVSGSDRDSSKIIEKLGVKVYKGHSANNVASDIDLVIYTQAIDKDNPELVRAHDLQLPVYTVYQVLGELSKDKFTIAVAGMHGKSTTTSIIGLIMEAAGLEPTVFVGTQVREFGGNFRPGKSEYLVSEACEYRDNFLNYNSDIGVVTNIEAEHLDYFKNLAGVKKSFKKFIWQIKKNGWLVYNGDNKNIISIINNYQRSKLSFSVKKQADVMAENIEVSENNINFEIKSGRFKDYDGIRFSLKIPGEFNIYNALAAICVAAILEIKVQTVQEILSKFNGVWRRFEFKGEKDGVLYYDDYAHHPTEIKADRKSVV